MRQYLVVKKEDVLPSNRFHFRIWEIIFPNLFSLYVSFYPSFSSISICYSLKTMIQKLKMMIQMKMMKSLMMMNLINPKIPSSSVLASLFSTSTSWTPAIAISFLSWWFNNKAKTFYFFIIHFFDSWFCIIIILKFLDIDRCYNEWIWSLILYAYDFSILFEPSL